MHTVQAFLRHKAAPLLLAAASGAVIFGLYPDSDHLFAAYFPQTQVAAVSNFMPAVPAEGMEIVVEEMEVVDLSGDMIEETPEQI